jgi:hypothetical protein
MNERPNDASDGPIEGYGEGPATDEDDRGDEDLPLEDDGVIEADAPEETGDADWGEDADDGSAGEEQEPDEAAAMAAEADDERRRGLRPSERRAARSHAERSQIQADPSLRIRDRASSLFVLVTVLVFGLIFLNGMVLGKGGLLTPFQTPTPVPALTPSPSPSESPSSSPGPASTAVPLPT